MNGERITRGKIDTALGVALRLLLAVTCVLGGAWIAKVIPCGDGHWFVGGGIGLVLIFVILIKERSLMGFCRRRASALALAGFLLYAAVLAIATYSELFDLGWFNWLPV